MAEYVWIGQQDVNMPKYVWIYVMRDVTVQVNGFLLGERRIQNPEKDLR